MQGHAAKCANGLLSPDREARQKWTACRIWASIANRSNHLARPGPPTGSRRQCRSLESLATSDVSFPSPLVVSFPQGLSQAKRALTRIVDALLASAFATRHGIRWPTRSRSASCVAIGCPPPDASARRRFPENGGRDAWPSDHRLPLSCRHRYNRD